MVTRHLYETEDVAATLLHAIAVGDRRLARHAASELDASLEQELLDRLLLLAWMLLPPDPVADAHCVVAAAAPHMRYTVLLEALLTHHRLGGAAAAAAEVYPDLPTQSTLPLPSPTETAPTAWLEKATEWLRPAEWSLSQAAIFLRAVHYALRQKHWEHAARLTGVLLPQNIASILSLLRVVGIDTDGIWGKLLESTVFLPLTVRILNHMYAASIVVGTPLPEAKAAAAAASLSVRSGRTFTIPPQALATWHIAPKHPSRLMGEPLCVAGADASIYWQSVCAKHSIRACDGRLVFPNDSVLDLFYATYFGNDDIPDEWSVAEREKSHGIVVETACKNPWVPAFHFCWV